MPGYEIITGWLSKATTAFAWVWVVGCSVFALTASGLPMVVRATIPAVTVVGVAAELVTRHRSKERADV